MEEKLFISDIEQIKAFLLEDPATKGEYFKKR